jgi:hypothetical protein
MHGCWVFGLGPTTLHFKDYGIGIEETYNKKIFPFRFFVKIAHPAEV